MTETFSADILRGGHCAWGRHREDLQPDCRAYTTAIDACRRVGAWTQAVQVLEDMEEMMVTPDAPWTRSIPVSELVFGHQFTKSLSHYRFFSKSVFIHSLSVAIQWYLAIHFSPDHFIPYQT